MLLLWTLEIQRQSSLSVDSIFNRRIKANGLTTFTRPVPKRTELNAIISA
jgi:hypothetical protein